jgi:two-component system chemotaxis response regulator CheY
MKILSVDDSSTMRRIIAGAAGVMGIETLGAANGAEALKILEAESAHISVILLDINMPGMSGLELLKKIKADPRWAAIPVMMVTSESERQNVIEAIQAGASSYLAKPFAPEDLIKKIAQSLGHGV